MTKKSIILAFCIQAALFVACSSENSSSDGGGKEGISVDIAITGGVDCGISYAEVSGSVDLNKVNIGGGTLEYGAEISKNEDFGSSTKKTTNEIESNTFKVKFKNLEAKTTYYYRVYLKASGIYYYGKAKTFITKDFDNVTKTGNVNNITFTSAEAICIVDRSLYNANENLKFGIAYSLSQEFSSQEPFIQEAYISEYDIREEYTISIGRLIPDTTYYYCSYTSDGVSYKFGEIKNFNTLSNSDYKYLNTQKATNVYGKTATLQGWSKLDEVYKYTSEIKYSFQYSDILNNLTNSDSFSTVSAVVGNGVIIANLRNLSENKTYYYRIIASIGNDIIAYGEIFSFVTNTDGDPGGAPDGYNIVWRDEFENGTELNSNDWIHEVKGKGWVNNELQEYVNHKTPNGSFVTEVKDGKLCITALKENGKVYSGRVYALKNQGWKYGYIEASIKLPKGKGTWPAFWMMPVNFTSWPADGEIDIMEEVGYHPDYVSSSLHANAHVHSNNTQVTHEMKCAGAEGEFHTYAILWTHENITTYVDGKVQLSYDNKGLGRDDWPYDDPFYVIFNLAWGGDWGGAQGVDDAALPATMEIEYIRVFQKK